MVVQIVVATVLIDVGVAVMDMDIAPENLILWRIRQHLHWVGPGPHRTRYHLDPMNPRLTEQDLKIMPTPIRLREGVGLDAIRRMDFYGVRGLTHRISPAVQQGHFGSDGLTQKAL